jgi:hypothetical protein
MRSQALHILDRFHIVAKMNAALNATGRRHRSHRIRAGRLMSRSNRRHHERLGRYSLIRTRLDIGGLCYRSRGRWMIRNHGDRNTQDETQAEKYRHPLLRRWCPSPATYALSYISGLDGQKLDQR